MTLAGEIAAIERRLKLASIPLQRLFEAAKINTSTWTRWRSGKSSPQMRKWLAVQAAADDLVCLKAAGVLATSSERVYP